jgi:hypothetical protein
MRVSHEKSTSAGAKGRAVRTTKTLPPNTPRYQSHIVQEELTRVNDKGEPVGGPLLAMLAGRASELNHTKSEMAKYLGVTYGYIAQLGSGHRFTYNISMEFADACTRYLGVPKMTVLMAAGIVKFEDTFERPDDLATALPMALKFIERDPNFGPLMPPELLEGSTGMQFFVIRLYEAATKRKFIPGEHTVESIAKTLKEMDDLRKKLLAQKD